MLRHGEQKDVFGLGGANTVVVELLVDGCVRLCAEVCSLRGLVIPALVRQVKVHIER